MLQTYLYNQYKSLGTQKVYCTTHPAHVTHTEYTLKHRTILRSAPIMYLIEVMDLFSAKYFMALDCYLCRTQ